MLKATYINNKPISLGNRVTFDTEEGIQAGFINDLRRDIGNGELYAWVELDHQWPGLFRAVPVADILSSDHFGLPLPANLLECECLKLDTELLTHMTTHKSQKRPPFDACSKSKSGKKNNEQ